MLVALIKKCNQRLFEKATPKICDQNLFAVTIEYVSSAWVGLKALKVLEPSPSSNKVFSTVAPWIAKNTFINFNN